MEQRITGVPLMSNERCMAEKVPPHKALQPTPNY